MERDRPNSNTSQFRFANAWYASLSVLFLLAIELPCLAQRSQAPAALRQARMDMIFSSSLFRSANRADATAAIRVWGSMIGNKKGFQLDCTIDVVDDVSAVRKRLSSGASGIVAVDVLEYFKIADIASIEPAFYAWMDPRNPIRYVLLVRAGSGISSIEDLRGKSVVVHSGTGANLGQIWFDSLLFDGHLGRQQSFFGSTEVVTKATAAILPVFFGKADAAIVDQSAFEVSREMNPQVGMKLRVLATSPTLIEGVICVTRKHEFHDDLVDSMRDLHLDAQGKQILTVFRFGRLMPIDRTVLESVRELVAKHNQLTKTAEPARTADGGRDKAIVKAGSTP